MLVGSLYVTLAGVDSDPIAARLALMRRNLDERAWRLLLGAEAKVLGVGGIKRVAAAGGAHPDTVAQGVRELGYDKPIPGRVRRPGAGRPPKAVTDPALLATLDGLLNPVPRGDLEPPLRWTTKSTAKLAAELTATGHEVSARTVAKLLRQTGYSLQPTSKPVERAQHPDRGSQFGYLNAHVERFQAEGNPVISVAARKKKLIGNDTAAGREREPARTPRQVGLDDGADPDPGHVGADRANDVAADTGWIEVDTDADTGEFAVESIRRWWSTLGVDAYPGARRLLITADFGGTDGSRLRLWKAELAGFATESGLDITVCHLPPGTRKWNRIEYRLCSAISRNRRGRLLESHEVVIETLGAPPTSTGHAGLDTGMYGRGIEITDKQIAALEATRVHRHAFRGDWNYTLTARGAATRPAGTHPA